MAIDIGTKLGGFEVTGHLGQGGMGEVYRARDTKLGREVAIKLLPEAFALDAERLSRFEREARVLASLDHPNIGGLYDFQEADGQRFLVMQLVEGETLADRIERGRLPVEEAVPIFIQIAEALEAAHAKGVVHRDLKPANVKISPEGRAIVLDFGLAVPAEGEVIAIASPTDATKPADSPLRSKITTDGAILGTPSYMAPEQARGKPTDKRVDIWAFGCCLFEALSGRTPFAEDTVSDTLAAVLKEEVDLDRLPKDTPWRIRELIGRCLEKDPQHRLRDIGDAWSELKRITTDSGKLAPVAFEEPRSRRGSIAITAALLIGLVLGVATAWYALPGSVSTTPDDSIASTDVQRPAVVKRFELDIGPTTPLYMQNVSAEVAISRDGARLAYTAIIDGRKRLYLRDLNRTEARVLPGTEDAWRPFFSPDGDWIAFWQPTAANAGKLMKMAVAGGAPVELCEAFPPAGGTWMDDGTIVFTGQDDDLNLNVRPTSSHLFRVSASGGTPERLTKADGPVTGEWSHGFPAAIPGTDRLLFSIMRAGSGAETAVLDVTTGQYQTVEENAFGARYAATGHIVFARDDALWAIPFDPQTETTTGKAIIVQPDIQLNRSAFTAPFAISAEGSFVYVPTAPQAETMRTMVWVDHFGREETLAVPPRTYWWPRVSPDGSRIVTVLNATTPDEEDDIWIHEPDRPQSLTRFTFDHASDGTPMWAPDGREIYFVSDRLDAGVNNIFKRRADGTGQVNPVWTGADTGYPADITPDATRILFGTVRDTTGWDVGEITIVSDEMRDTAGKSPADLPTRWLLATRFGEGNPKLSPDGKWLAHDSDETGAIQTFVRPFPSVDDARWTVSTDGGVNPTWSPDGTEIYYRNGNKIMAVSVETEPTFRAGAPRVLFDGDYFIAPDYSRQYDLEYPEGDRFLMIKELPDTTTTKLIYVQNWFQELNRLAPHPQVN